MNYVCEIGSPLGCLTVASDGENVTGLWIENQKYFAETLPPNAENRPELPVFLSVKAWLKSYFSGKKPDFLPSFMPFGNPFRQSVWKILCEIPYGSVMTYGQIAKQLKTSPRAVGGAVGHNPISILIPCHRVVGANGKLVGFAGGLDKKSILLNIERNKTTNPLRV
jgi:methylated-DNA-[protein]-cysteine S-methyltransferase